MTANLATPQEEMTTIALREIGIAVLPAALGSIAVVYSNIINIGLMSKIRYADKQPVHPYKPWDDKGDKADQHFRAFKACQNGTEWTVYMLPCVGLYGLYTPLIPKVGLYVSWFGLVLSIAFAYYNVEYVKGYIVSTEGRIFGWTRRTMALRFMLYGALAGMASTAASAVGLF